MLPTTPSTATRTVPTHPSTPTSAHTSTLTSTPTFPCRFVGSVALHEGALVANYPFDGYQDGSHSLKGVQHTSPDHVTFLHLATRYAQLHKTMSRSQVCSSVCMGSLWMYKPTTCR